MVPRSSILQTGFQRFRFVDFTMILSGTARLLWAVSRKPAVWEILLPLDSFYRTSAYDVRLLRIIILRDGQFLTTKGTTCTTANDLWN